MHRERYRSFQDVFVNLFRPRGKADEFWALRDVTFSVEPGETVGIIGSNGSGKSTLLKLISRIIEPTTGRISVQGKVSALLELGAGFHPDLSGRDNVYLNWSLMGVSRKQVDACFDDVVAFAELEDFIDTPVRLYSSGMYVRLAFAAAILMQSEILIVDEVLAVGDVAFQEKCFSRIHEIKRSGRSILIVSHALESVRTLCDRIIWLDRGRVAFEGPPDHAIARYLAELRQRDEEALERNDAWEKDVSKLSLAATTPTDCEITRVRLLNEVGHEQHIYEPFEPMIVEIDYAARTGDEAPLNATVMIRRDDGLEVHRAMSAANQISFRAWNTSGLVRLRYHGLALAPGHYTVDVALSPSADPLRVLALRESVTHLVIRSAAYRDQGVTAMRCSWSGSTLGQEPLAIEPGSWISWAPSYAILGEVDDRFLDGNWYPPEGETIRYRWMADEASVYLRSPSTQGRLVLSYTNVLARDGRGPRWLAVRIENRLIARIDVAEAGFRTVSCSYTCAHPGVVRFTLAVDQTTRPVDAGLSPDVRELGLLIHEIWIEELPPLVPPVALAALRGTG
jgi:ABC-type polysaccharide/polyol phosphate transport system ATPase subunit